MIVHDKIPSNFFKVDPNLTHKPTHDIFYAKGGVPKMRASVERGR